MTRLRAPRGGCVIRAYRHGLGDCFLLAFATRHGRQRYMLIDCGVLLGTSDAQATMTSVAEDIEAACGGKLDVLVVTHQHWDHISGFGQARDVFNRIDVGEMWVSWAENADDPDAKILLERYGAARLALAAAEPKLRAAGSEDAGAALGVLGFLGPLGTGERLTTASIMDGLIERFADRTRHCSPGDKPHAIAGLPGVSFYVLGPPRGVEFIRKSNPSKGQVYLDARVHGAMPAAAEADAGADGEDPWAPFNPAYEAPAPDSRLEAMKALYAQDDWRRIDGDWIAAASDLAIRLDAHLNNTSLVLAIELETDGRVLLFPADAQVGSWLSWHETAWDGKEGLTAADLLARTVFYKVGHHGSHNATLGDKGLELMTHPDLAALIPLDREMAKKQRWDMPYSKLLDRLRTRAAGGVHITDEDAAAEPFQVGPLYTDIVFPAARGPARDD